MSPGSAAQRINNVKLSAQIINGLISQQRRNLLLQRIRRQTDGGRGLQTRPAYVKGETVDEIGGGICQTSSTLYLACLTGNLRSRAGAFTYVLHHTEAWMPQCPGSKPPTISSPTTPCTPKIYATNEKGYITVQIPIGTNVDPAPVNEQRGPLEAPWETIYQEDHHIPAPRM